jgi:hypothetical protein
MSSVSSIGESSARFIKVLAWMLAALTIVDFGLGKLFQMPADPHVPPSATQRFFNYGRSVQGKLQQIVGEDDSRSGPIALAGWIDRECSRKVTTATGKLGVSIFGNSFSAQLADQLSRDQSLSIARYGGPGAPPNHSYACFMRESDGEGDRQPIQIIGVTSSSLPRMESIWGATTSFELPQPFTFPRYHLSSSGELVEYNPSIRSVSDLRRVLSDAALWKAWLAELSAEDHFYSRFLIGTDFVDTSVIGRMIRRGFGQDNFRRRSEELRGSDGNIIAPDIISVLPVLISNFAKRVRERGAQPIVVLFEEYGSGRVLERILARTLSHDAIDYVSSMPIAPANDRRNFLADGHFKPEVNQRIAKAVIGLIQASSKQEPQGLPGLVQPR